MSTDHAISSIALSRLKVARISDVNDPFELFAVNCIKPQVRKALKSFKAIHDADKGVLPHGNTIPEGVQQLLFVTKFAHWSYEEEVRAIVELEHAVKEGTLYFWPWSEQLQLKEVILGPLCCLSLEQVSSRCAQAAHRAKDAASRQKGS
ncbi:MAG: hypothetical protein ABL993_07915 [Vicinamibacterales bacterium]